MRVIVVGATGAIGRQILAGLAGHKAIDDLVSLSDVRSASDRRACDELEIEYRQMKLTRDLASQFQHSDAVVYAGWPIGCSEMRPEPHHLDKLANVCDSAARANIRAFVYGSSALGYSDASPDGSVDEYWRSTDKPLSPRSLQIAQAEELVDEFDAKHEIIRVVVLRPALVVSPSRTPRNWRERLGKRAVKGFVAGRRIRLVPQLGTHEIQVVHVSDLVDAFCLAVTGSVVGKFNLAADPITSDMLAETFQAKVRVPPRLALKLHTYAQQVGLAVSDTATLRLGLEIPLLSTAHARAELGWSPMHSGSAILKEWAQSFDPTEPDVHQTAAAVEMSGLVESLQKDDACALYRRSLDLFGERVHAIRDDQWSVVSEYEGQSVMELVISVARQQYQTGLRLRGTTEEEIERQLPGDPLGFSRAEGWDLAAERGAIAMAAGPADALVKRVLPDVICDVTLRSWFLARAIGFEGTVDSELTRFVEERIGAIDGNKTAQMDAVLES